MTRSKKLFSLVLITTSVLVGLFIIGTNSFKKTALQNQLNTDIKSRVQEESPTGSKFDNAPQYQTITKSRGTNGSNYTEKIPVNLTEEIAKNIAGRVVQNNPGGLAALESSGLNLLDPESLLDSGLIEGLENFDYNYFRPQINKQYLKIGKSNDQESQDEYLTSLGKILNISFGNLEIDYGKSPSFSDFEKLETSASIAFNKLSELETPEILFPAHVKEIELLAALKNVFGILKRFDQDPFKSFLAMKILPVLTREFSELNKDITQTVVLNIPLNL